MLKRAHVGGLEDVFGEGGVENTTLHKGEELVAVVKKRVEGVLWHVVGWRGIG